jgi:hypothetical protein
MFQGKLPQKQESTRDKMRKKRYTSHQINPDLK